MYITRTRLQQLDGREYYGNLTMSTRNRCTLRPGEIVDTTNSKDMKKYGMGGVNDQEIHLLIQRGYFKEVEKPKNKVAGAKIPKGE